MWLFCNMLNKFHSSTDLSTYRVDTLLKISSKQIIWINKSSWGQNVFFGQLLGMSDNISFNLAGNGYNVAKYLPFGPVRDVMPYLIRRAEENTSVAGQTSRELTLIKKEKERRKL